MEDSTKYVECCVCRKRIPFGTVVLTKRNLCGIYCSPNCYAEDHDIGCCRTPLSQDLAWRKDHLVFEVMI